MDSDSLDSMGTRVGNEILDFVPATSAIKPLRDVIIIEPLEMDHGTRLAVVYRGKPLRGMVLAVGPGHYPRKYNGPKGKRSKAWDSKHFLPCDVKVGDVVDLGGGEIGGYLFSTIRWGAKEVVMCREADVCVIREPVPVGMDRVRKAVDDAARQLADAVITHAGTVSG